MENSLRTQRPTERVCSFAMVAEIEMKGIMQEWMVYRDLHATQYSHHTLVGNIERGRKKGFATSSPVLINKSISVWGEKANICETTDEPLKANYVIVRPE